ncbi:MAG: hypothetical protein R2827_02830 [Bdellovibrionales bacterium]
MIFFNALRAILVLMIFTVTACDFSHKNPLDKKQKSASGEGSKATFYAYFSNGDSILNGESGPLGLINKKEFQFQVCLKDYAFDEELVGHDFLVMHNDVKLAEVKTKDQGCLHWSESIEFNPVMKAKYIVFERRIVSKGVHKGEQVVQFAVNPWNEFDNNLKIPAVISDITHDIPEGSLFGIDGEQYMKGEPLALQKLEADDRPKLFIKNQDISTLVNRAGFVKQQGYKIRFSMQFEPKVKVKNYNGDDSYIDITQGDFVAKAWLLQRDETEGGGRLYQVSQSEVEDSDKVKDKNLTFRI